MTRAQFLARIESYLEKHGIAPSTFGRRAVNDAAFVANLRSGRVPLADTMERVIAFMRVNRNGGRGATMRGRKA